MASTTYAAPAAYFSHGLSAREMMDSALVAHQSGTLMARQSSNGLPSDCATTDGSMFQSKWGVLIVGDLMGNSRSAWGGSMLDNLQGEWDAGQVVKPCNAEDWQAVVTPANDTTPALLAMTFITTSECSGRQVADAINRASNHDPATGGTEGGLWVICSDMLVQEVSDGLSALGSAAETIVGALGDFLPK